MSSSLAAESATDQTDQLPRPDNYHDDVGEKDNANPNPTKTASSRVECLDGLRGIACIAVFTYHFLWPWTSSIMLGYGFLGPLSPERYTNWLSLPIICLLHRGRPMVSIFFAISGYVLSRHLLKSIHDRNLGTMYRSLSSSVFRRIFRLYIPPTISMLIVAILAQMGAFRTEDAMYNGPDSVWLRGTVFNAQPGETCSDPFVLVAGSTGVAEFMGLRSPDLLGTSHSLSGTLCIKRESQVLGPVGLYSVVRELQGKTKHEDLYWVQYGGSTEEHPLIYGSWAEAIREFSRVYAEWANPFNVNNYHTRYDPHTYTMPIELRGSMLIYVFLLGTSNLKAIWRLCLAGFITVFCLFMGRWDMATFMGATMMSDIDIWVSSTSLPTAVDYRGIGHAAKQKLSQRGSRVLRWMVTAFALYLLSYPDIGPELTPGFVFLSGLVPRYYAGLAGWMFYQAIGALLLIPCLLRSRPVCEILESRVARYLGKISFSIYLIHGPLLHCLGIWVMPRLFEIFGRTGGFLVGWATLLATSIFLAHWWYKKVDVWSMTVGKRLEKRWTIKN